MESGPPVQVTPSVVLPSVSFHTGLPSIVSGNPARTVSTMMPHVWNVPCPGLHMSSAVSSSLSVTQAALPVSLSDTSVQHRGKAPPIDTLLGKMLKPILMVGYQHWKELQPGITGLIVKRSCSWLDICVVVLYLSGI